MAEQSWASEFPVVSPLMSHAMHCFLATANRAFETSSFGSCIMYEDMIIIIIIFLILKVVPRIAPRPASKMQASRVCCAFPASAFSLSEQNESIPESPKANCRSYIIPGIVPVSELFLAEPP